jgi:hypothetical protein
MVSAYRPDDYNFARGVAFDVHDIRIVAEAHEGSALANQTNFDTGWPLKQTLRSMFARPARQLKEETT